MPQSTGNIQRALDFDLTKQTLDTKIAITDVVDALTSTISDKPLSANQGAVVKSYIDNLNAILTSSDTTLDSLQEIVNFIKINKTTLDSLSISSIAGLQAALDTKLNASIYTAADILDKLKTVDGSGSGLDADLLDGLTSSAFLRTDITSAPAVTNTVNLGSTTNKFANIYSTQFVGLSTSSQLADLAEIYTCEHQLPAGTIVTFSSIGSTEVEICQEGNVPFGVVSDKPGFILNSEDVGVPVALIGKTPVSIKGRILKGEPFTIGIDGVGVICDFTCKNILGRALENKNNEDIALVKCFVKCI